MSVEKANAGYLTIPLNIIQDHLFLIEFFVLRQCEILTIHIIRLIPSLLDCDQLETFSY